MGSKRWYESQRWLFRGPLGIWRLCKAIENNIGSPLFQDLVHFLLHRPQITLCPCVKLSQLNLPGGVDIENLVDDIISQYGLWRRCVELIHGRNGAGLEHLIDGVPLIGVCVLSDGITEEKLPILIQRGTLKGTRIVILTKCIIQQPRTQMRDQWLHLSLQSLL
eukprot:Blabericola_migrator_1__1270@NODE_1329_length_4785_cov_170_465240_g892_i0_p3_GENE_NODE_1329_length_4785_cov_170_465240_g892_i0NODE_1329_length_4785_cov_170_465240_g892_i0_p3_ORF_typecomplete_len164_score21_10Claudin_2/PF13903_6/6_9_NODE_1329_length_4785_cov_170_465240_g892_i0312803